MRYTKFRKWNIRRKALKKEGTLIPVDFELVGKIIATVAEHYVKKKAKEYVDELAEEEQEEWK